MRRALLLIGLATLIAASALVRAPALAASAPPWTSTGSRLADVVGWWNSVAHPATRAAPPRAPVVATAAITLTNVLDWQSGTLSGVIVSNNAGGELRLAEGGRDGTYTSVLTRTQNLFNAVGAVWRADVPRGTGLRLEVRGGPSTDEADLTAWQTLAAGDAQSSDGALALESVRPFPAGMAFLQLRATFSATTANASPVLSEITLSAFDATQGPSRSASLLRVPAPYGPATLTAPPLIVQRETWGAPDVALPVVRQAPKGIIVHQIGSDDVVDPLPFLRALAAYDVGTLGWDDVPFHFMLDRDGIVYAGHQGGPTATVARFSGGDAAIHVALIGVAAPTDAQRAALAALLAWLGQAYAIPPGGQHTTMAAATAGATAAPASRPNIIAHGDTVAAAADNTEALRTLVSQMRESADQATVRARWYFAEGNSFNFAERLSALNTGATSANVRFSLLREPGPSVVRDTIVPAGGRADLIVNDLFNDTSDVPAIVESNAPVIAERFMNFGADITASPGVKQPSRVWYFAEGSTEGDNKTYLLLFNPQSVDVGATILYMQGDGTTAQQRLSLPPQQRAVVTVGDALPGKAFGARVIADEPIVAERTMIFGPGSTPSTGGVHSAPGVVTLSRRWYFAEGTTAPPFRMNLVVLNPNAQPTNVAVTFLTDSGTSLTRKYAIPATTRLAINVNEVVPELGIATTVVADRPVAAERALYWSNTGGDAVFGMANPGAIAPSYTWRFADGRTNDNFQEYLLLSNPNKNPARVTVEFIQADGKKGAQSVLMAGTSRYTMAVHQLYPGQTSIAATVQSTQQIVAERALYIGAPGTEANRGGASALGVPEELP
jgi:hypothetical protein